MVRTGGDKNSSYSIFDKMRKNDDNRRQKQESGTPQKVTESSNQDENVSSK